MKLDLKLLCMALGLVFCVEQSAEVTSCDHDGSTTTKKCQGKRGGAVVLKASGTSGPDMVTWKKEEDSSTTKSIVATVDQYEKSSKNEAVLKILNLKGPSEGTYIASSGGITGEQKFIVQGSLHHSGPGAPFTQALPPAAPQWLPL